MLRDPRVEYIGEIDETHKDEFLGNAFAYLFPINMAEMYETVYRAVMTEKFEDADAGVRRSGYGALGDGARGLTRIQHPSPLAQSANSEMDLGVVGAGRMVGSAQRYRT